MKKVAIYNTNTDQSDFAKARPSDPDRISALLDAAGADYQYSVFDTTRGEFLVSPADADAVILGGSPADIGDGDPWIEDLLADIRRLEAAQTPMIGLCFGHQAIMAALGGRVEDAGFWIFGAEEVRIDKKSEWIDPGCAQIKLHAANHAQVTEMAGGFEVLGSSENCPIALTAKGDLIFTTQFHPEIDAGFMHDLIAEYGDILGPGGAEKAGASVRTPAEGAVFARWARKFIEADRS